MKRDFIVNRQGKDFVLYAGLLDQAHTEGLKRITTKLVQAPTPENGNLAICWAEVETDRGMFSGIGDATPANVGRMIAMHIVRMAETRAKARALRDAINVGTTALEELADVEDDPSEGSERPAPRYAPAPAPAPAPAAPTPIRAVGGERGRERVNDPGAGRCTPTQQAELTRLLTALHRDPRLAFDLISEADAHARIARMTTELARQDAPPVEDPHAPTSPASTEQKQRLAKLQRACGVAQLIPDDLTVERATALIGELVSLFNTRHARRG